MASEVCLRNLHQPVARKVLRKTAVTDSMEMDAKGLRSGQKRAVGDPVYLARVFPQTHAQQYLALPCFDLGGILRAESELAHLFPCFSRYNMPAMSVGVPLSHVFLLCKPFEVIRSVVGFVSVLVVDNFRAIWPLKPAGCDKPMKQAVLARFDVTVRANSRGKWNRLSKNFPAPRNSKSAIEDSVFDSFVDVPAQHGVSPLFGAGASLPEIRGNG